MLRFIFCALFLLLLFACSSVDSKKQVSLLKEIVIVDTNSLLVSKEYVQNYYAGAYMAIEEINKNGGILGLPVKFITKESFGNQVEAYHIIDNSIRKDKPLAIMGTYNNGAAIGVARIAKEQQIPFLITGSPTEETIKGYSASQWTFRLRSGVDLNIAALSKIINSDESINNAVIITYAGAEGNYISQNIKESIKKDKPNFKFADDIRLSVKRGITDILISRIKKVYTTSVIIAIDPQELRNLDALLSSSYLSTEKNIFVMYAGEPEWLDSLGINDSQVWQVTGFPWYNIHTVANKKFINAYKKKYKVTPRYATYLGYIGVYMLTQAISNAKVLNNDVINRVRIAQELLKVKINTPLGIVKMRQDHISNLNAYVGLLRSDNKLTRVRSKSYLSLNTKMVNIIVITPDKYLPSEEISAKNREKSLQILQKHYKTNDTQNRQQSKKAEPIINKMYNSYVFPVK